MSPLLLVPPESNIAPFNWRVVLLRTIPGPTGCCPLDWDARAAYPPLAHRDSTG